MSTKQRTGSSQAPAASQPVPGPPVRLVMAATDRSASADRAVRWAAAMADHYQAGLLVAQVIVPQNPAGTEAGAAESTRLSFAAEELAQFAAELASDRGQSKV